MSSQHSFPFWRICLTKKNIGTRLASSVPNAGHLWLISNLDQKRTESIADHATTLSLQPDVTDVGMSSEQVQNEMAIFSKLCISDPKMCTISFSGMKKMEYKTRQWHEKCFVCCTCKNPIGTKSFIPKEHDIYCAKCYEDKFATKCIKCNKVNFILFFFWEYQGKWKMFSLQSIWGDRQNQGKSFKTLTVVVRESIFTNAICFELDTYLCTYVHRCIEYIRVEYKNVLVAVNTTFQYVKSKCDVAFLSWWPIQ